MAGKSKVAESKTENNEQPVRNAKGQFVQGNSGDPNGRGKGSRNKLGEAFLEALYEDFKDHGIDAIKDVRKDKPDQYLRVIAQVLPKQVNLKPDEELTNLSESIHATVNFLSKFAIEAGSEEDTSRPLPN